ncbi:hypothetical protein SLEP1_g41467 [Rubroshorea leprosula]|uniref:Uncharacterized protein n=1 Tax=Rubroshorea leprosula TaxID=152421 RepID=A0AAV5L6Q9_9ROSI|nr:hypothetical protein SLEP1_g41467 [Rubroshorea leprosula]
MDLHLMGAKRSKADSENCKTNGAPKRKQSGVASEPQRSSKSPEDDQGVQSSPSRSKASSHKQPKREKLGWNVLRSPKPQKR